MARLLPHLPREIENELTLAVMESNDGYPQHLRDMCDSYESITDEDQEAISRALWEGRCEGRDCGRDEENIPYNEIEQGRWDDDPSPYDGTYSEE